MNRLLEYKKKRALRPDATPGDLEAFYAATTHDRGLVLSVLFHHLSIDKIPRLDGVSDSATVRAQVALGMLGHSIKGLQRSSRYFVDLRDHWDAIWAWCSFLLRTHIDDATSPLDDSVLGKDTAHFRTMFVLRQWATSPPLLPVMLTTSGLLALLIHIYRRETNVKGDFISAASVTARVLKHLSACRGCSSECHRLSSTLTEELMAGCLQRMRALQPSLVENQWQCILLSEDLMILFSCSSDPDMHRLFLAKNSVKLVLRVLSMCTASIRDIKVVNVNTPCERAMLFEVAINYLRRCILLDRLPCVVELLEGRLLVVLFKLVYHLRGRRKDLEEGCNCMISAIIPFLVHRPVLLPARRSLKTIIRLESPSPVYNLPGASGVVWKLVQNLIDHWNKAKILGELGRLGSTDSDGCENPTHYTLDSTAREMYANLKRCAGCEYAHYCSRVCQREHWDKGHKQECRQLANQHRLPVNISSRDRNFLYQAINSDLQVREIELKDRAKLANTPHVVIQRDYTTSQVECRVIPMAEFNRDGINDDRWSAAFARVFARPPAKLVLCCAVIPRGSQPYKMLWFEDVEDITISTRVGRWTSRPVGRSQFY